MANDDFEQVLRAVGRRVAELRSAAGLTQEVLAEELGVSVTYLQRIEAGTENLTVRSLVRLAGHLSTSVANLFAPPTDTTRRPGRPRRPAPG